MLYRLTCAVLLLTLALYALPGFYAHMASDDFCYAAYVNEQGIVGSTQWYYLNWSGRYTASALLGVQWQVGRGAVWYLPALLLTSVVLSAYILTRRWLVALAFTLGVLSFLPNVTQQLYWSSGALSYFPALVFALLLAALWRSLRQGFTKPPERSNA